LAGAADRSLIALLIAHGADVNARVTHGLVPLHLAASRGALDVIEMLLRAGADPTAAMDDGVTPAAMAESRGHGAAAALLNSITADH
jgi:ankyrin repeat protein